MTIEDGQMEITNSASVDITGRHDRNFDTNDANDGDNNKSKPPKEDKEADDESQTGDESDNETDDQNGESGEGDGDEGDGKNIDYKTKFSESTKEAQRLLGEIKTAQDLTAQEKARGVELEKQLKEIREVAEGKNPEGLKLVDLQRQLAETTQSFALEKEERMLDSFFADVKTEGASSKKEALRALKRAQPNTSLVSLWDEHFKAGVEAAAKAKQDKKTDKKKNASETGKGTSGREPAAGETVGNTGYTLDEFNKLPVAKRRSLLAKMS
jgi:hypothetical protein